MADPLVEITRAARAAIAEVVPADAGELDPQVRPAQNPRFGDYQINAAMGLARRLGRPPRDLAEQIAARLQLDEICEPPAVAGPGFINVRLTPAALARYAASVARDERAGVERVDEPIRVVVDYSSPNAAKEMHVGHLRSTILGDAIVRVLEFLGHDVIRQNHLGDWGTQFGMLLEYLAEQGWSDRDRAHGARRVEDLNVLYREAKQRFDDDPEFARAARRRVVALQAGDEESLAMWRALIEESLRHFEEVYRRLGVTLRREHVCPESFYNPLLPRVVERLRAAGLLEESDDALCVFPPGFRNRDDEPLPLIVQKSDGGYLYATTDLAGILHRVETLGARRILYVVGAPQSQHLEMVFAVARMAGWVDGVSLEHVAFGSVLDDRRRMFRTRAGRVVRLLDLIDDAEARALQILREKNPELSEDERAEVARIVGIGALKYADLSNDRIKDYVFSFERMLSFDGNTAPYLQNAYVRIRSIFRRAGIDPAEVRDASPLVTEPAERALVLQALRFPTAVHAVAEHCEPHRLCSYLYELAASYHQFYETCPVLRAEGEVRASRLVLSDLTARILARGLDLLGIEVPERM